MFNLGQTLREKLGMSAPSTPYVPYVPNSSKNITLGNRIQSQPAKVIDRRGWEQYKTPFPATARQLQRAPDPVNENDARSPQKAVDYQYQRGIPIQGNITRPLTRGSDSTFMPQGSISKQLYNRPGMRLR